MHHGGIDGSGDEAAREFGFQNCGVMCLVEPRKQEGVPRGEGRPAAAPICFPFYTQRMSGKSMSAEHETSPGCPQWASGADLRTPGSGA